MTIVQPETFTLTDQEAAALQSANMARQAKVAETTDNVTLDLDQGTNASIVKK